MKINIKTKKSGMTLVELIVYLGITMIVCVLIVEMTSRMVAVRAQSAGESEVTFNANLLLDRLSYEVSNGESISGQYPSNTLGVVINGGATSYELADGRIYYQGETLTNNQVEIEPTALDNFIFEKINNGGFETVKVKFRAKSRTSNFSRIYETTIYVGGNEIKKI